MARICRGDRPFPFELGAAIDALRIGPVRFAVFALLVARKDIVRGQMDDRRADVGCRCRDRSGAQRIDRMRALGFVLGPIDRRVGGRRHDNIGLCRRNRRPHCFRIGEIKLRATGDDDD